MFETILLFIKLGAKKIPFHYGEEPRDTENKNNALRCLLAD